MFAELRLDLVWLQDPEEIDGLRIRRDTENVLDYDDGLTLGVRTYNPSRFRGVDEALDAIERDARPGSLALVAGDVPVAWRADLRASQVGYLDRSGAAEVHWPRLDVQSTRLWSRRLRRTDPVPLQKGHALVAQEVLLDSLRRETPSINEVAEAAEVAQPTASKAVSQLAAAGLLTKRRIDRRTQVHDVDQRALGLRLLDRSPWPRNRVVHAYLWGSTSSDVLARLMRRTRDLPPSLSFAVTGRLGAAAYGIIGTAPPRSVHGWVAGAHSEEEALDLMGIEVASPEEANLSIALDRWGVGTHRARERLIGEQVVRVSNPVRVWCDLHAEQRGSEFADQLWGLMPDVV
jgi:hypothetical protein